MQARAIVGAGSPIDKGSPMPGEACEAGPPLYSRPQFIGRSRGLAKHAPEDVSVDLNGLERDRHDA